MFFFCCCCYYCNLNLESELEIEELDLQLTDLDRQLEDVQTRIQANQMDTQQTVEKIDARFKQVTESIHRRPDFVRLFL